MFYLSDNVIEFEGHKLHQVKRPFDKVEVLGGYIDINNVTAPDVWLEANAKFYGKISQGKIVIGKDSIVANCELSGNIIIKQRCTIRNCQIMVPAGYTLVIERESTCIGQTIRGFGKLPKFFLDDGDIRYDDYSGVYLMCTKNYCHVDCQTFTYEDAQEILTNDELWDDIKSKTPEKEQRVFDPDVKQWLAYWCEKQLWRKNHTDVNKPTHYCKEVLCPHYFGYCNMRFPCDKAENFSLSDLYKN